MSYDVRLLDGVDNQIWQIWKNWTIQFPIPDCPVRQFQRKAKKEAKFKDLKMQDVLK
jgi:hypothetical protein